MPALPIIGGDRTTQFVALKAYIEDLNARAIALGVEPMESPLPTVGGSENVWGDMMNAYLTELSGKVEAVEIAIVDNDGAQVVDSEDSGVIA